MTVSLPITDLLDVTRFHDGNTYTTCTICRHGGYRNKWEHNANCSLGKQLNRESTDRMFLTDHQPIFQQQFKLEPKDDSARKERLEDLPIFKVE